jgi:xanthine permease XanP
MDVLSRLLPPGPPRRRPPDLSFAVDDRPPAFAVVSLAAQHAVMALSLSAYVLIACRAAGLGVDATRAILSGTVMAMAVATLLQAVGRRVGAGALMVHIPDPFYIGVVGGALKIAGPPALVLIGLTSGMTQLLVARLMPYLRTVFPAQVAGVVVLVAGLSLVEYALEGGLGLDHADTVQPAEFLVFVVTFGIIAALSVWGSRSTKLFALFGGLVAGIATAAACGLLQGTERLASAPMFGVPDLHLPSLDLGVATLASVAALAVMVSLDTLACVVILDKMDDAGWRRPDMRRISGGITANAIGDIASGIFGGMQVAPSSANIGLAHASRSTSRVIGLAVAAMLAVLALMPKLAIGLTLMPGPVMGAVALYAASFLITSGIELVASRALDARGVFLVGVSVSVGLVGIAYETLVSTAPALVRALFEDAVVVSGLSAVALNLLFRLKSRRSASRDFGGAPVSSAVSTFIGEHAGAWSVRHDVKHRAELSAGEAAEAIARQGGSRRLAGIAAHFDEFSLEIVLAHSGAPLRIDKPEEGAIDPEADEDALVAAASLAIITRLADRVAMGERNGSAYLLLHFDH